jgi:integrase
MRVVFSQDRLAAQLICEPGRRKQELVDAEAAKHGAQGLYAEVRSPGLGTWYLRYKDAHNKTCHQKIGSTAVIGRLEARKEAKRLKAQIPARGIAMLPEENKIERYMDEEELARLLQVLRTDRNRPVCNVVLFLLSTGCRLNEALSATWAEVALEHRVFTVRATNSKRRKVRSVPLNDSAVAVLEGLGTKEQGGALFVSDRSGERLTTIAKQWDRIRTAADLPKLRLHDLRHQFASFLVNDGRTLYEVQQILGHSSGVVSQRYAHLSTKTLQEAAASASTRLIGRRD